MGILGKRQQRLAPDSGCKTGFRVDREVAAPLEPYARLGLCTEVDRELAVVGVNLPVTSSFSPLLPCVPALPDFTTALYTVGCWVSFGSHS